jgi:hypothetical protein
MKLLKHITTAFLVAILLLPLVTPSVLQLRQLYVQWEMLEALEEKELTTITIDINDVQWVYKGKECIVKGEMFDVKESKQNNRQVTLTGLFDKKEKEIKAAIAKQTKEQQNNTGSRKWIKLFQFTADAPACGPNLPSLNHCNVDLFNKYKSSFYTSPFTGVVLPPPKYS